MSKKAHLFNTTQLCLVWGISRVTLQSWINDGLPIGGKDNTNSGSPRNLFDWEEVNTWLQEHPKKATRRMNSSAGQAVVKSKPLGEDYFMPDDPNQAELLEIERRLQQAEKLTYGQWAKAQTENRGVAVIEKYQKNWLSVLDKRTRFESQFSGQLKSIRCNVSGVNLDLSRLSDDERRRFNELITRAEC